VPPCVLFEDAHLLVINKPAGVNTHSPSPYAGEGIYDWLRNREPRWASLAIIHRLDKQTSGVLAFALSPEANRSLTAQFSNRQARKTYLLLTDRPDVRIPERCRSAVEKAGDRFISKPWREGNELAETEFKEVRAEEVSRFLGKDFAMPAGTRLVQARPLTGRTHQIRLHAAQCGFPALGDGLYGGAAAERLWLHASELTLAHPVSGAPLTFTADWPGDPPVVGLRKQLIEPEETTAFRVAHGEADGLPGIHADKLGDFLLVETENDLDREQRERVEALAGRWACRGVYHKRLIRDTRGKGAEASPRHISGAEAPDRFVVRENGLAFELSFTEGYSVGLFLDQRDNRRRLLTGHIGKDIHTSWANAVGARAGSFEVLNVFAYTCGFSVAAAKAGARATSLDLSKKYLEWGRRNFDLNGIPAAPHDFIYGDAFDWMKRLCKKQRQFDCVILDPPTFSKSREHGVFRAERDYGRLIASALPILRPDGILLASTNAAGWAAEDFLTMLKSSVSGAGREIRKLRYYPQPPDFPVSRRDPAYLKTAWLQM
jgi:23S rRNA (cytosine1962-C5)-methyltransferase